MPVRIHDAPLAPVAAELRATDRDVVRYVDDCCDRIDEAQPELHALVPEPSRRERLREAAAALRDETPADARPRLYGVPVGVKDIIHVDRLPTRAGSALPPELFAGPEATCVTRLREAGALVAGKTVTTEFAGGGPGLTRNPHALDHTPGGSSSGSAAGVAAGLFPLAIGTQTGGSVVRPAAYCGVVGMKPSLGRIPRDGILERSSSLDHVGMFTQDVAGMRLAAAVLCDDWAAGEEPVGEFPVVAVPGGTFLQRAGPAARTAFAAQRRRLAAAGCEVRRVAVPALEEVTGLARDHRRLHYGELALVHEPWFDDYRSFYRTPNAEAIAAGRDVTVGQLAASRARITQLRETFDDLLATHDADLWVTPAAPGPAPATIRTTGDPVMNRPWTYAGVPVVTVPAGQTPEGLPLGLQLAGPYMRDERLLKWAEVVADAL
ncbi:amidase [Salinirubellus salinus]|uniref:Amidase n=1 Tax=Salinirubellus salinus TaxID=1364945 RepID=A0A9E7R2D6_9EURY|nr:amidase [Salinirubellus salinus]UWM54449.1 amidase [Salinirubellus salinus]